MKAHRAIRYRLHPGTRAKHERLPGLCSDCRTVWNHFVGELRDGWTRYCVQSWFDWRNTRYPDTRFYSLGKRFAGMPWLKEYSANIVKTTFLNAALNILAFGNGATARGSCSVGWPLKREIDRKDGRVCLVNLSI